MNATLIRLAALGFVGLSLSACIVAPGGYGHRHGGGYYAQRPVYYAAPAPRYHGGYEHRGW